MKKIRIGLYLTKEKLDFLLDNSNK